MTNETEDALYEMAEQAWNECWPDEPTISPVAPLHNRKKMEGWLRGVFNNILTSYDGPLSDIADHLGDFGYKWIEKRVNAIIEDAKEAEAQARADSREDW